MNRLIEFFAKQGLFGGMILIYTLIVGSVTLYTIQREAFPNVTFDVVQVVTVYPGAAPEEVEKLITNPLEQDLKEVTGIKRLTSVSTESTSIITLQLDPDQTTLDEAKADVKEVVDRFDDLPGDSEEPRVLSLETKQQPIIEIFLSGDLSDEEIREKARFLELKLENIREVAKVQPKGMRDLEIHVEAQPTKLAQYQLSLGDLINAVRAQNISVPGGTFERAREDGIKEEFLIRTVGEYENVEEVGATVIRANELGQAVRVRDVAKISYALEKMNQSFRGKGKSAIDLTVIKKENADAITLVEKVRAVVDENRAALGDKVEIAYANDLSYYIKRRLSVLQGNLVIGLILVLVVLSFFFPFKIALLTAIGIPFSFLGTMIFFNAAGISLNLLTMMGLIIVLGMLVDDAIVVVENAVRYIDEGLEPKEAAIVGTQQVWLPVTASVLTTLTVFAPLMFMSGIFGKFVKFLPAAVIIGLICSILECFFILPHHIGYLIKKKDLTPSSERKTKKKLYERVDDWWRSGPLVWYRKVLEFVFRYRWGVVAGAAGLFFVSLLVVAKLMNFVLFPPEGVEVFLIKAQAPTGTTLEETTRLIDPLENLVESLPSHELDTFVAQVGIQQQDPNDPATKRGSHFAQIVIYLTPATARDRSAEDIIADLREKAGLPEGLAQVQFDRINPGPPAGAPISIGVRGREYKEILPAVEYIKAVLAKEKGVMDLTDSHVIGKKELWVKVDSAIAASAGLSVGDIGTTVRAAFEGIEATQIRKLDEEVAVRVMWPKETRDNQASISDLKISNRTGSLVPITSVAQFGNSQGIANYEHEDNQRQVRVLGDVDTSVTSSIKVNGLVKDMLPELEKKFPDVTFNFGGEDQDTEESLTSLFKTFGVALLGILLILVVTFQSLTQAALVLFLTVPLGVIAVIWTFFLHGWPITFMGMLGVIALSGVIVNNSIVYISFVNEARAAGDSKMKSLMDAGLLRLRPIFLTTFTTVVGILPTAYGIGGLDQFVVPIALALGWGLAIGSLLSTIVFPASVAALDDVNEFFSGLFKKKA